MNFLRRGIVLKKVNRVKKKNRTYSPIKVCKEIALVQWPSIGELLKQSNVVIWFVLLVAAFFVACESLIGLVLKSVL